MPTQITPFTKTPSRQNPSTFSEDMDTRLLEENSRITEMNAQSSENNATATEIEADRVEVIGHKNDVISDKNAVENNLTLAQTASSDAVAAKDEIKTYVIPTEATYNLADLDTKMSSRFASSGTISKAVSDLVFETAVGNEYKMADKGRFANLDGNVLDTYGDEQIVDPSLWINTKTDQTTVIEGEYVTVIAGDNNSSGIVPTNGVLEDGKLYRVFTKELDAPTGVLMLGCTVLGSNSFTTSIDAVVRGTGLNLSIRHISSSTGVEFTISKNISVKEITTADLTSYMPEVQVQDQATNGLVVQSSVNAGDYVVASSSVEVTNGDLTTDTSGWAFTAPSTFVSSVGAGVFTRVTGGGNSISQTLTTVIGVEYTALVELLSIDSNTLTFTLGTSSTTATAQGTLKVDFIATSTSTPLVIAIDNLVSFTVDNISVQLKEDIYRATEDTADMYDKTIQLNVEYTVLTGEVAYITEMLSPDGFYLRIGADETFTRTSAADYDTFTNTWVRLGTATNMSLLNPYFQQRDYVSNQVLAYRKSDGTLGYETLFVDATETDTVNDVMLANGWSKLSNGYYSKGLVSATPMGMWQTGNKGYTNPMYNPNGMRKAIISGIGSGLWYQSTFSQSVATCFTDYTVSGSTIGYDAGTGYVLSGFTGRPDNKFYDIIYKDQWQDWRLEANECLPAEELLAIGSKAKSGQVDGVSGMVGTYGASAAGSVRTDSTYIATVSFTDGLFTSSIVGETITVELTQDASGTTYTMSGTVNSILAPTIINFDTIGFTSTPPLPVATWTNSHGLTATKTIPILSSGSHLTTDLIGDPANYPQAMKDILASGKPLIGINPLLVDQNLTVFNANSTLVLSEKGVDAVTAISTGDAGVTWGTPSTVSTGIENVTENWRIDAVPLRVVLNNYTAKNTTTKISDPKAVKAVGDYATGTNSHSVYKGNQLVPTGKVNVGNGSNGLESRGLENAHIGAGETAYPLVDVNVYPNATIEMYGFSLIEDGTIFLYSGPSTLAGNYGVNTDFEADADWTVVPTPIGSTPDHNTIALDNSNSPAVKFLETIAVDDDGMAHYQVMAEEMVWDFGADEVTEATVVADTDTVTVFLANTLYKITGTVNTGYWRCIVQVTGAAFNNANWIEVDGDLIWTSGVTYFQRWDGNGFGSSGNFKNLTNTTSVDLNGNTVKHIVSSIPLNKYLKGE